MHAWISPSFSDMYENQLLLGQNYEISKFQVRPFTRRFKCFQSNKQIILTNTSEVKTLEANKFDIPKNVFDFTDLNNLESAAEQDSHLIGKFYFQNKQNTIFIDRM